MSDKSAAKTHRLLVGIMLGAALALIGLAVWMIVQDKGSPVLVAAAGSMLAAFAGILAAQSKKKG